MHRQERPRARRPRTPAARQAGTGRASGLGGPCMGLGGVAGSTARRRPLEVAGPSKTSGKTFQSAPAGKTTGPPIPNSRGPVAEHRPSVGPRRTVHGPRRRPLEVAGPSKTSGKTFQSAPAGKTPGPPTPNSRGQASGNRPSVGPRRTVHGPRRRRGVDGPAAAARHRRSIRDLGKASRSGRSTGSRDPELARPGKRAPVERRASADHAWASAASRD